MPKPNNNEFIQALIHRYWRTANTVMGFAVTSMIAYLYALAKTDFKDDMADPVAKGIVTASIVVFGLLNIGVLKYCGRVERELLGKDSDLAKNSSREMWARIGLIALVYPSGVAMTWLFDSKYLFPTPFN